MGEDRDGRYSMRLFDWVEREKDDLLHVYDETSG